MRASPRTPVSRARHLLVGALVATLLTVAPGAGAALAQDPRIDEAARRTAEVQQRLDELLQRLAALESEVEDHEAELAALEATADDRAEEARVADHALGLRIRESYIRGNTDPTLALLASDSVAQAQEQARLLAVLADRSRGDIEAATAARTRTLAAAAEIAHITDEIRGRRAEVDEVRGEVGVLLAEAQADEQEVREVVAAEIAERERQERERRAREEAARRAAEEAAREREARERASRNQTAAAAQTADAGPAAAEGGDAAPAAPAAAPAPAPAPAPEPAAPAPAPAPAPVSGGVACPVGQPRNYSDTWGAGRSGGRSHKGTDILAPRGTPVYAYETGTVSRMNSNSLGGISLYLQGDSGTVYYYTHLQGYVAGLSAGQRVSVGQHIAINGDTGNARGIPHVHFEVMPGGGGSVNPFPYVQRACG